MHTTAEPKNLATQERAIIHFITTMDIDMINTFLDDNLTYQDFEKCVFISKLQDTFDEFKKLGDTKFITHEGKCNSCNKGCKGFSFIGDVTNNYMDIIVEASDGKIKDLYECADFKNINPKLAKNERIYIHKFQLNDDPF